MSQDPQDRPPPPQIVLLAPQKSAGVAVLLSILFGPLGMLYSTVLGGLIMLVVSLLVAVVTLGFGLVLTWPICVIWAAIAANSHNRRVFERMQRSRL